jgi:ABC-type enterochelin transport system substrate-binding protein
MRFKIIAFIAFIVLALTACSKESEQKTQTAQPAVKAAHEVTVHEVVQVTTYTYIRVRKNIGWPLLKQK